MNILSEIVNHKKKEVEKSKKNTSVKILENKIRESANTHSLKEKLIAEQFGIIAEFKRKSPSKPHINLSADVVEIVNGYKNAGAVAVSVLTDNYFFGGSANDLIIARKNIDLPVLRKDFIIDEYQILEAKAIGADIILLIAAILTEHEIKHLAAFAKSIGLEVLLEVHSKKEIEKSENQYIDFIGVNNRNLDTFKVDINNSVELASNISNEFIKISESGITSAEEVTKLIKHGYKGFLIGENFMKSNSPENSCKNFINEIKSFAG